jgi:hypothetical protein
MTGWPDPAPPDAAPSAAASRSTSTSSSAFGSFCSRVRDSDDLDLCSGDDVPAVGAAWWPLTFRRRIELIRAAPHRPFYTTTELVPMELRQDRFWWVRSRTTTRPLLQRRASQVPVAAAMRRGST